MRHRSEKNQWNTMEHQKCLHMPLHIHSLTSEALWDDLDRSGVSLLPTLPVLSPLLG